MVIADQLLNTLPEIIEDVYGPGGAEISQERVRDLNSGVLVTFVEVRPKIPFTAEFVEKDRQIFRRIKELGMEEGLKKVVITQVIPNDED
jgi:hypothetical protein